MPEAAERKWLATMRLYVLLTRSESRLPIVDAAREVIEGGADVLQLREKDAPDSEILKLGETLRTLTADAGVALVVNDRPDLACLIEADGCHVGQGDITPEAARKVLRPDQALGVSTHNLDQARRAMRAGADYIGVGPIFPTTTRGYCEGVGTTYLRQASEAVPLPLVAIGGITPATAGGVMRAGPEGCTCIAVCSAILGADDPRAATAAFRRAIAAAVDAPPSPGI